MRATPHPVGQSSLGLVESTILALESFDCLSYEHYDIALLKGLLNPSVPVLADLVGTRRALLVTTPTVAQLYGASLAAYIDASGLDISVLELACTEQSKSLDLVAQICSKGMDLAIDRRGLLIGMGGGICTDLVTVAASWIRRGIAHIRIPTTLVGQIDAAIGLKGAVNFRGKKSYLGCFYPPEAVLIDPLFLRSLPASHLRCGLAEIIKIALVRDAPLFDLIEAHARAFLASGFAEPDAEARQVLWLAVQRMQEELASNPYENKTYRRLVDFGHTFSPLVESASQFTLRHGEAVAVDMALSAVLAVELGILQTDVCNRILSAIASVGLPIRARWLTLPLCREALREAARHRGGAPNLVVPAAVGNAIVLDRAADVPDAALGEAIRLLATRAT
jgi:2-epi-5-epi-valiolone synthase